MDIRQTTVKTFCRLCGEYICDAQMPTHVLETLQRMGARMGRTTVCEPCMKKHRMDSPDAA